MTQAFPNLSSPGRINGMVTRNRIAMPPMGTNYADADGYVTDRIVDYYVERSKGGAGLIIVEATCVQAPIGKAINYELCIDDDRFLPGLSRLAKKVQEHGARIAVQLHHAGMETSRGVCGGQPVGPSPISGYRHLVAKELTVPEIAEIVEYFARAAERAERAGFDAVELHAAHFYLIAQFLSKIWNRRTDGYGGSIENRARFLKETVEAVRKRVGPRFPVWCRINGEEYGVQDGITLSDARIASQIAERAGADGIHVSAFGGGADAFKGVTVREVGALIPLAENVKKAVHIPVIAVGRIDPALAEKVIAEGKADFVAMGRTLIADPYLPQKVLSGNMQEVRPCILCRECSRRATFLSVPIECSVNAAVGREGQSEISPAGKRKKVLVVGGGPGGLETARVAALRGHQVDVFEQSGKLGGQLLVATVPPFKQEISKYIDYLTSQMNKLGCNVHLNEYATPAVIEKAKPDEFVLATGGTPVVPDIPGIAGNHVATANDILAGKVAPRKNVVVIGGGLVGCETADFIASRGSRVTVIEMLGELGRGMEPMTRRSLMERLAAENVSTFLNARVDEITDTKVIFRDKDGVAHELDAETVVLAAGVKPRRAGFDLFKNCSEAHTIGDCFEARGILEAVARGFRAARDL